MAELWSLRGIGFRELAKRVYRRSWKDEIFGQSARLAFYFFFALFPMLLLLIMLSKSVHLGTELRRALLYLFQQVLPMDAAAMVIKTIWQLNNRLGAGMAAVISGVSAAWAAHNGTWAVMTGLNKAYEVDDQRPWWRIVIVTFGLTVALTFVGVIALVALLFGNRLANNLPHSTRFVWPVAQWTVTALLLLISFAIIYRFGPNLKDRRWRWSSPGAVAAVILWVGSSLLLRLYDEHFHSSRRIYGGLHAVAMLLLWFYLTGAAIFIGGETNSEIEKAAAEAGERDVRHPEESRTGETGAPLW